MAVQDQHWAQVVVANQIEVIPKTVTHLTIPVIESGNVTGNGGIVTGSETESITAGSARIDNVIERIVTTGNANGTIQM